MVIPLRKATVTLNKIPLAATSSIVWRFITGVSPYTTTFTVHRDVWFRQLNASLGHPLTLEIRDSRGVVTRIKRVFILHTVPSDSPNRVSFVVADKRWLWSYTLVARDFNMVRKTGDRTAKKDNVPVETETTIDTYDWLAYSLDEGAVAWTAKRAMESVLNILEGHIKGKRVLGYRIESFPISESKKQPISGAFTVQNVSLRDRGDVALGRLLGFIPGAEIFIDAEGIAVVFDGTDINLTERHFRGLPVDTWAGEAAIFVDRKVTRPREVVVHYQREVEVLFEFSDDYSSTTTTTPNPDEPYLENVLPTVDPETTITEYDSVSKKDVTKKVPAGTWVRVDKWLQAMDADKPTGSYPWTFAVISRVWAYGDLDGNLGAGGSKKDTAQDRNISARVQMLKEHFRTTFRINRRYMERIRKLIDKRVGLLDPVTGARAPAAVWGRACIIPSKKGGRMSSRAKPEDAFINRNIGIEDIPAEKDITSTEPMPAKVEIIDNELGIFHIKWLADPYGNTQQMIPSWLRDLSNQPNAVTRDLTQQGTAPMGQGIRIQDGNNGLTLEKSIDLRVLMTIIPAAPNNKLQFHQETVQADDVLKLFRTQFGIKQGAGPPLEVFVAPGEATARFAWDIDASARLTLKELLGLVEQDPDTMGVEGQILTGFVLCNQQRHLTNHARSFAAELLVPFADGVMGTIVTKVPLGGIKLAGTMASASVRVGTAPSARVDAVHQFAGQQRAISRFGLLSQDARAIILGTLPFED